MKIAIQGNSFRGKEVIQILKDLGGKGSLSNFGYDERMYYWINSNDIILESLINIKTKKEFNLYTLEEFEKEFPFKIGNEVIFPVKIGWASGKITGLTYIEDKLKYEVYTRTGGYHYVEPHKLSLYPMKKERNITLTLEKAKEWYKKGGDLKQVALQVFTEKELNPLPRSWEEYTSKIALLKVSIDIMPISSLPKKYIALYKLERLRDCWIQGWKPNWLEGNVQKYVIQKWRDKCSIETTYVTHSFLSFPTYEMAKEFLECFRDLIEKAGDLI